MLAAANFENITTVEETFNENLFIEFMKKVSIWDYYAITKAHYLTLPEEEKKDKISRLVVSFLFLCFFVLFYLRNVS